MIYYGNNDYRDYLAHYGVKGMKWGHKKNDFNPLTKTVNNSTSNSGNSKPEYTRIKIVNDTKTKLNPLPPSTPAIGGGTGKMYEDKGLELEVYNHENQRRWDEAHQDYLRKKKERTVKTGKNIVSALLGGFGGVLIRNLFSR